jgi:hypothetical protein
MTSNRKGAMNRIGTDVLKMIFTFIGDKKTVKRVRLVCKQLAITGLDWFEDKKGFVPRVNFLVVADRFRTQPVMNWKHRDYLLERHQRRFRNLIQPWNGIVRSPKGFKIMKIEWDENITIPQGCEGVIKVSDRLAKFLPAVIRLQFDGRCL